MRKRDVANQCRDCGRDCRGVRCCRCVAVHTAEAMHAERNETDADLDRLIAEGLANKPKWWDKEPREPEHRPPYSPRIIFSGRRWNGRSMA